MQPISAENPDIYLDKVEAIEGRLAGRDLTDTVLLTGSSIMELWQSAEIDLQPLKTVNIGIGGTKVCDHITFFERLIRPHRPKAVVIYVGSNDINGVPGSSKSGEQTAALVIEYFQLLRAHFPKMPVFYINIIAAPSKGKVFAEINTANRLVSAYILEQADFHFIDCAAVLQNGQGEADPSLYLEDQLHFKPEGYQRWRSVIRPALLEILG